MQRFSTRLYTLLFSFLASGFESVAAFIIEEWNSHATRNQIITAKNTNGAVTRKLWLI
jgi:hypothetical protein